MDGNFKLKETTDKRLARDYIGGNIERFDFVTNAEAFKKAGKL